MRNGSIRCLNGTENVLYGFEGLAYLYVVMNPWMSDALAHANFSIRCCGPALQIAVSTLSLEGLIERSSSYFILWILEFGGRCMKTA